jgi:multidrug efflux system outer membrane protein
MDSVQRLIIVFWISGFWLYGCKPHIVDRSPEPMVKGGVAYSMASPAASPEDREWWRSFNDEKLDALIQEALEHNFNVLQGLARLDQADALTRQSRAARLPQVNIEASALGDWAGDDTRNRLSRVGGALAWEVDVFNRLGSAALARQSEQAARLEDVKPSGSVCPLKWPMPILMRSNSATSWPC